MKLFHGTTLNRFLEILRSGHLGTDKTVWNVSEESTTYFYGEDNLKKDYEEAWYDEGIREALLNAEISLIGEEKNLKRIVLVFDSEDLDTNLLKADTSCKGMDTYQYNGEIPVSLIKEIYMDTEDLDIYRLYFLGLGRSLQERESDGIYLSDDIQEVIYKYPEELRKAAEIIYNELLSTFWMENMTGLEVLEAKKLEDFKEGIKDE